jgi:hypothetical protein
MLPVACLLGPGPRIPDDKECQYDLVAPAAEVKEFSRATMRIEFSRNAIKFGIGCGQKHSSTSGTMASELKIESHRGGSVMSELPFSTLKTNRLGR